MNLSLIKNSLKSNMVGEGDAPAKVSIIGAMNVNINETVNSLQKVTLLEAGVVLPQIPTWITV